MPQRRALSYSDFEEVIADLRGLRDRPYQRAGTWSLGQVCDHLQLVVGQSIDGFTFQAPRVVRLAGPLVLKWLLWKQRFPTGVPVPPPLKPAEAGSVDDRVAVDKLIGTLQRYSATTHDLHPSPLFGRMTRDQWDRLNRMHAAHHLSFIVPGEMQA